MFCFFLQAVVALMYDIVAAVSVTELSPSHSSSSSHIAATASAAAVRTAAASDELQLSDDENLIAGVGEEEEEEEAEEEMERQSVQLSSLQTSSSAVVSPLSDRIVADGADSTVRQSIRHL